MLKKTSFFILFTALFFMLANAQLKVLKGVVMANGDVEGIHILNKTAVKYAVTYADGRFEILAKANDTLTVSSLKYQTKEVVITTAMILQSDLKFQLTEDITQLDEVILGRILSGSLGNDMSAFGKKPEINFYDVGIPGYIGKPKTINERKLADADGDGWGAVSGGPFGGGVSLDVNKLLNRISGRTKKLRAIVALDAKEKCRKDIQDMYSEVIFKNEEWTETVISDYFYFCRDDKNFNAICNRNDPTEILLFLKEKLAAYKVNLDFVED